MKEIFLLFLTSPMTHLITNKKLYKQIDSVTMGSPSAQSSGRHLYEMMRFKRK